MQETLHRTVGARHTAPPPRLFLVFLFVIVVAAQGAEPASSHSIELFENRARLPVDLYTSDGTLLAAGSYRVRVRCDEGCPVLLFVADGDALTEVKALPAPYGNEPAAPSIPLTGTLFLRSSEDPVGTDADRHHSKTGHAQYHETRARNHPRS